MKPWVPVLFWIVAGVAALVTFSGVLYASMGLAEPLHISILGRPFPSWALGVFMAFWGGYTLVRLFRLPWRQGTAKNSLASK